MLLRPNNDNVLRYNVLRYNVFRYKFYTNLENVIYKTVVIHNFNLIHI